MQEVENSTQNSRHACSKCTRCNHGQHLFLELVALEGKKTNKKNERSIDGNNTSPWNIGKSFMNQTNDIVA